MSSSLVRKYQTRVEGIGSESCSANYYCKEFNRRRLDRTDSVANSKGKKTSFYRPDEDWPIWKGNMLFRLKSFHPSSFCTTVSWYKVILCRAILPQHKMTQQKSTKRHLPFKSLTVTNTLAYYAQVLVKSIKSFM